MARNSPSVAAVAGRSRGIAAALSLIAPGVGHLYVGAPGRGAWAWLVRRLLGLLALAIVVLVPGSLGLTGFVLAACGLQAAVAIDAVRTMRTTPVAPGRWYHRPAVYAMVTAAVIVATLAWGVAIGSRVADRVRVPTDTMAPTIMAGERMVVVPRYGARVKRGDLVVFKRWETRYVKRVVGLAGDTVAMRGGALSIDGRPLAEPYAMRDGEGETVDRRFAWQRRYLAADADPARYRPTAATWGPLIVPSDAYFVLGDNRGASIDSRYDGFLADSAILGRPVTVYFSRDPATGQIRWRRIGRVLHGVTPVQAPPSRGPA